MWCAFLQGNQKSFVWSEIPSTGIWVQDQWVLLVCGTYIKARKFTISHGIHVWHTIHGLFGYSRWISNCCFLDFFLGERGSQLSPLRCVDKSAGEHFWSSSHNHGTQKWVPPIGSLPFRCSPFFHFHGKKKRYWHNASFHQIPFCNF